MDRLESFPPSGRAYATPGRLKAELQTKAPSALHFDPCSANSLTALPATRYSEVGPGDCPTALDAFEPLGFLPLTSQVVFKKPELDFPRVFLCLLKLTTSWLPPLLTSPQTCI